MDLHEQLVDLGFRLQPVFKLAPGRECSTLSAKIRGLGNPVVTLRRTYGYRGLRFLGDLLGRKSLGVVVRVLSKEGIYVGHRRLL
jgi:hypothetical protein